jgi:predicted GNAT superfamily acetyltransferase
MRLRQLTTIDEFRQVVALEHEVWGYTSGDDAVPVPMLVVSAKVGGLLIGAFDDSDRLAGFAYSLPGVRNGRPFQWSHMLGVAAGQRDRGVAWALKMEQRRLTLEMGLDLIEWTFDPLQALNAHLNFAKLGVVVERYERDVYGDSSSPLHRGTSTDRFVAEWWIRSPRVRERIDAVGRRPPERGQGPRRDDEVLALVNGTLESGSWMAPSVTRLALDAERLGVVIPTGFSEMQQRDVELAREWRAATREIFEAYLPRGYQVADFALDRAGRRGTYLLVRTSQR